MSRPIAYRMRIVMVLEGSSEQQHYHEQMDALMPNVVRYLETAIPGTFPLDVLRPGNVCVCGICVLCLIIKTYFIRGRIQVASCRLQNICFKANSETPKLRINAVTNRIFKLCALLGCPWPICPEGQPELILC